MKKSNLLLVLFAAITLFSCGSDDDATSVEITEANLVGIWQWTASTENGVDYTLSECDLMDTIEYNADNTVIYTAHDGDAGSCSADSFTSEWTLAGDVISYEQGDGEETILELTDSTLKVKYSDEFDGITDIYIDTYTKQ